MQHEAASFTVQDAPTDGKGLEAWAMQEQARFGVWLLKERLKAIDEAVFREKPAEWICKGFKARSVETVVGTVTYLRRVYQHRLSRERFVPADEYVGWPVGVRVSPQVEALCAEMATEMKFRAVAEVLWKLRGVKISHQSAHQKTQEVGERRVEEVRQEAEELFSNPGENAGWRQCTVFLEVDGMFARAQRKKKGQPRHFEIRLAVIHEGWEAESPAGRRYRLKRKRVVVEATSAEAFWEAVSVELAKEYDLAYCQVVINGDGAEWIRQGVEYFPQAVFQLDRFHWLRALRRAVGNSVKALRQVQGLLEKGDWAEAELLVQTWKQVYPERAELLEEFWGYVWANRENLGDWRKRITVELEIARGLGAAESNIDAVLVSRFKRHRRSWSVAGANRLGHLVALRHNGLLGEWLEQEKYRVERTGSRYEASAEKRYRRYDGEDVGDWLKADLPLLRSRTTPLVTVVRGLAHIQSSWVA